MQNQKPLGTRILSLALTAAMVATMMPQNVFAEGTAPQVQGDTVTTTRTITAVGELGEGFAKPDPFDGHTYVLDVKAGTPFAEVKLPTELSVTVEKITTTVTAPAVETPVVETPVVETPAASEATSTEPTAPTTEADTTVLGNEPATPSGAEPAPVEKPAEVASVANQGNATIIETTQENVPVTWKGDKDYTAKEDSNVVYTAVLPEGYALKDGVVLPIINVKVGKKIMTPKSATSRGTAVTTRAFQLDLTKAGLVYAATGGDKSVDPTTTSIKDSTEGWSWDLPSKTLTLSGANIDCSVNTPASGEVFGIQLGADGKIVLTEGSINNVKAGDSSDNASKGVSFTGKGSHSISGKGTLNAVAGVGNIDTGGIGIYSMDSTLTINDATINATSTGSAKGYGICGILDVKSGTITATGSGSREGYGIFVRTFNMSGGTVTATGEGSGGLIYGINGATLTITGGTLSASAPDGKTAVELNQIIAVDANVTGAKENFESGVTKKLTQTNPSTPVKISFPPPINDATTLQAAIDAAAEGKTLKLIADIDLGTTGVAVKAGNNVNFTIDLNGHKLTSATTTITHNGTGILTITDSASGGTGILETTSSNSTSEYTIKNASTGTVSVTGGKVSATGVHTIYNASTGTIKVTGGTVSNDIAFAIYNYNNGGINLSGGTVSSNAGAICNENLGLITVSGGAKVTSTCSQTHQATIWLKRGSEYQDILNISGNADITNTSGGGASTIKNESDGKISMTGGTVSSINTATAIYNMYNGLINISGGTVRAENGTAILNDQKPTNRISGNAIITSQKTDDSSGTVHFGEVPTTADGIILYVEGSAKVENTATVEGFSAWFPVGSKPRGNCSVETTAKLGRVSPVIPAVSFDSRGGSAVTDVDIDNGTIALPTPPKWGDYTFDGWWTDVDGKGTAVTATTTFAANTTVYAKWTKGGKTVRTTSLDLSTAGADIDKLTAEGWKWDNNTNTLTLSGANIDCSGNAATADQAFGIRLPLGANIELTDKTESTVVGGPIKDSAYDSSVGLYVCDDGGVTPQTLTINGTGTLNAIGGAATGDSARSYGISCSDNINITGGTINATGGTATGTSTKPELGSSGIDGNSIITIAEGATVNGTGGSVTATCTNTNGVAGYANSTGIIRGTIIATGGAVKGESGTVNFTYNGSEVPEKETSTGVVAGTSMTLSGTAVVTGIGKTSAIECYNVITAVGATVTNGTADNASGMFESGVTKILTQKDADKTIPVEISFGPSIAVAAQNGTATYGTSAKPTFAISSNNFGGSKYPDFAPSIVWTSGSAPTGVTTAFSPDNATLTVTTTAETKAGGYTFKVVSPKKSPETGNYESAVATLKVGKREVTIAWDTTTSFVYDGNSHAPTATVSNAVNGDVLTVTVTGEQTNVGDNYTATAGDLAGTAAGNYKLPTTAPTTTFAITAKPVTVNDGNLEVKKAYDGNTDVGTATGNLGLEGVVTADDGKVSVSVVAVGVYPDANIGKDKTVTLTISLTGSAASNYTLGSVTTYEFKKAEITKTAYTGTQATAPNGTPTTKGDKSITIAPVTPPNDENVEYAISTTSTAPTSDKDWQISTTFDNLEPNIQYFFFARVKENDTHAPGGVSSPGTPITTDKSVYAGTQATAPDSTPDSKTDVSITLKTVTPPTGETVQYGIDKDNNGTITWQSTTTFNSLTAGTEYKFYTRVTETNTHKAGKTSAETTIKTDKSDYAGTQATKPDDTKATKTDTTVTLNVQAIDGETVEYGYSTTVDGTITWQDSNVFTKLKSNTDYYFFARVKETNTNKAGTTSTGTQIKTDKVDYTGIETTAPEKAPASKTGTSITLKTVTLPTGETVEYGIDKDNNGTIIWQNGTTFDGLDVGTEYKFYTRVKESDTHKAGATSAETTITTQKANTTVGGKVTLSGGTALADATVTLTPSDPVLKTTTNSSGVYTFADVPEGVYSLVITKGTGTNEITITDTVIVAGTTIGNKDITFPDASKNTVVVSSDPKAPVAVSGMNDLLDTTNIDTTLETEDEKNAVTAGGSVDLTFTADSNAANDKEKLEALAATKGQTIDMLLDLSVKKTVKDASGNTIVKDKPIHSLATIIEVNIPIKPELQGKADLTLYRVHGETVEPLGQGFGNRNSDGEYYTIDPSKTFMTAYVKNFSSYGIGFTAFDVTITDGGTGASGSGKYSNGDIVTINAGSKSGYTFDSWTVTPGTVNLTDPKSATTSFNMPAEAVTVKANWTSTGGGTGGNPGGNPAPEVYYYINATTSKGGSINTPERVKVVAGGSASFTITPDKGYQIADVLVNGNSIGAKNSYVFTNVNSDQTIHATFKKAGHRNPQTGVDANVD